MVWTFTSIHPILSLADCMQMVIPVCTRGKVACTHAIKKTDTPTHGYI